ncbi:MAG: DUF2971 domain-containing protein [Bacteroidaceae bacterium]|nr:DUF2971 domain-containing protein [Bacteroidaceae bacterium]
MGFPEEIYSDIEVDPIRDKDIALYRFVPFDALLEMFSEKALFLVNTSKWEDVYENFVLKDRFITQDDVEFSVNGVIKRFFGQSWSGNSSSDAMWRIYSPDKKSVKIKTTIGDLYKAADDAESECNANSLLGKVLYLPKITIEKKILSGEPYDYDKLIKLVAYSSFVKRQSFKHESEYRLIFVTNGDNNMPDTIKVPIEPFSFIKSINFDPRADGFYVERCKKILERLVKFPTNRIYQSDLYTFKPITIHTRNIKIGRKTQPEI